MPLDEKKTLLLVEDDFILAFGERKQLERYGYSVVHVSTGEEAVEYCLDRDDPVDLILMDINLGEGMDGTEAARLILRELDIPLVFLSSHIEAEVVEKTERISSYGYVSKDSGIAVLDASVKMAFRLFDSRRNENAKEEALRESEERLRQALEGNLEGLWEWDVREDEMYLSDGFANFLGIQREELPRNVEDWLSYFHPEDRERGRRYMYEYLEGLRPCFEIRARIGSRSGGYRWLWGKGKALRDEQGEAVKVTGICTDISEHMSEEVSLQKREERYERALDGTGDGLWDWNFVTDEVYISDSYASMLGFRSDELSRQARPWEDLLHPEDKKRALAILQDYLDRKSDHYDSQFRMRTKHGEYRWINGRGKAFWDDQGRPTRITGTHKDITDLMESRIALLESEERYRSVFDNAREAIMVAEADTGRVRFANPAAGRLFGYGPREIVNLKVTDIHPPGSMPMEFPEMGQYMKSTEMARDIPCCDKNGRVFPCDISSGSYSLGGREYVIGYFYDHSIEKGLKAELQRERELFTGGPVASVVWLPEEDWPISYVSENIRDILGYESGELIMNPLYPQGLVHPEDLPKLKEETVVNLRSRGYCFEHSCRLRHKEGHYLWIFSFIRVKFDEFGEVREVWGYLFDQTRLKEAESEIVLQKTRLADTIAGTGFGTWDLNLETGEAEVNDQWISLFGYSREEIGPLCFDTWKANVHPDDLPRLEEQIEKHLRGDTEFLSFESRVLHRDGSWRWVLDKGRVTERNNDGRPLRMFGIHQDITERKEQEELILQQLEEKEILLREVHHRIKNNMNSVSSLLKLQRGMAVTSGIDGQEVLQKAIGRLEGMRVLYDKLLDTEGFRDVPVKPYFEDLIRCIADTFPEFSHVQINRDIEDIVLNNSELFPLGLIVNELITNALKYAFPGEGRTGRIDISLRREGNRVVLDVRDNGTGLPEDFSLDEHSGFGLTLVMMLVKQLRGEIKLLRRRGVGFEISFGSNETPAAPQAIVETAGETAGEALC